MYTYNSRYQLTNRDRIGICTMTDDNHVRSSVLTGNCEIEEDDVDESQNDEILTPYAFLTEDTRQKIEIEAELERLNRASEEINKLENELDETRSKYTTTFSESSTNLTLLAKKIRKSIQKSRKYFELKEKSKMAQAEALKAARQFQTAYGVYKAAKETITLAEMKLTQEGASAHLSSAWQEMLNHATIKVMEAEMEKTRSEEEHHKKALAYAKMEREIQSLERKFKSSIKNARYYFEYKANEEVKLQQLKQNVLDLQSAIADSKLRYADALHNLETISEHIHESRRKHLLLMYPREPGVGAEHTNLPSLSELSLDDHRDLCKSISNESEIGSASDTDSIHDVFENDECALMGDGVNNKPRYSESGSDMSDIKSDVS